MFSKNATIRSPLTVTFIQSTILNAISNICAQIIDQYKHDKPFTLNTLALLQFITYGLIIVPINFSWQKAIEARYPGFPTKDKEKPNTNTNLTPNQHPPTKKSHSRMRNFASKFLLDLSVGGVLNILLFVVLINLLKGRSVGMVIADVKMDFWPLMLARLKFRPIVSTLLYTAIPVDRRVVFGSACGVIWGIYLSLYAAV